MVRQPYLLYVYPWMPYPRRLMIYLRERHIPPSAVTVVPVTDPSQGDAVIPSLANKVPPRPKGSLPILAIPPAMNVTSINFHDQISWRPSSLAGWCALTQSSAIMKYLDTMTLHHHEIRPALQAPFSQQDPYLAAKSTAYEALAGNVLSAWNTPRLFGSKSSSMPTFIPAAAKEGLNWVHRDLAALEKHLSDEICTEPNLTSANGGHGIEIDCECERGSYLGRLSVHDGNSCGPSYGDIMLLSFLELVDELYDRFDALTEAGKDKAGKDAYGRELEPKGWYPHVREFYGLWKLRPSAVRGAWEEVPEYARIAGRKWAEGVWEF